MRNIKRFIVILLVVCSVFILASCKNCSGDKDNFKDVPTVSNPDSAFLQIGDYKVTKKEVYHQLLNSYGLEYLLNEIDDATLPAIAATDPGFQEYLDGVIYGDEEKTEEALNKYLEGLILSGLSANENDENYYVNYHLLVYRRLKYAQSVFKSEITDETFTEKDKENAFESNFRKNNDLIVIRFNSQNEANSYLVKNGIDLNYLNTGWQKADGTKLEASQVQAVFETIYQDVNNTTTSGVQTYTYEDLTKVNSTLANAVYYWEANGYSKAPTTYGSYVYLIYKVSETGNLDKEGNTVTYEDKADEVLDLLVEANVSSTYATKVSLDNHIKHGLKIYDFGLETLYKTSYKQVYEALEYGEDEYTAYPTTDEESTTNVFSYTVNGQTVTITADDIYSTLTHNYGNYLASLYLKQYVVLANNPVYNFITGEILDKETYDEYYKAEVKAYKDAFEAGDYEDLGYPSSYGWNNFIRDYLGLLSEQKILVNLDSTLYEESLDTYKEQFYFVEAVTDPETGEVISRDQLVQDKMEEIFAEYFNATAIGISAYYDKDLDGVADEVTAGSEEETILHELLAVVYEEVKEKDVAISAALSEIILEYNISNKYSNNAWATYRAEGLQLAVISSATYSATSSHDDELKAQIKSQADAVLSVEKAENGDYSISGQDISSALTLTNDAKVTKTFRATDFVSVSGAESDIITHDDKAKLFFVTKSTKPYYISESKGTYKPSIAQYLSYLEDASDTTTTLKNCITTYYIPAINELANDTVVTNNLVDDVLELLNSATIENKDALAEYLNACKITEEAD